MGNSLGYFTCMSNNGFSSVDYAIISESLMPSVKYFKTNDFTLRQMILLISQIMFRLNYI